MIILVKSSHNNDIGIHVENHSGLSILILGQILVAIGRHWISIRMVTSPSPHHGKSNGDLNIDPR